MTEKRFTIEKSSIVEDGFFIGDNIGKFSFPTTKDKSDLIMYMKHLNELHEENQALKSENKELIELIRHCYENWSEEKKKMVGEISNGLLGD